MKQDVKKSCPKTEDRLIKIGMFAGMNHVTIKTLRYYDEQGLLTPAYVESSGYRYYTLSQIADLHQILALRNMGFTIDEIKAIQRGKSEKELLITRKKKILKEIAELSGKLAQVESYLLDDQTENVDHVLIKEIPECIAAVKKTTVEKYDNLFDLMPRMGAEMEVLNCVCAVPEYCFVQYLDSGYKEEQIAVEICEAVTEMKKAQGNLCFKRFPAITTAACIFHRGCYDDLPKSYAKILRYVEENGYEISGNIRESYIDGIWNRESESDWLTEIQVPIQVLQLN